MPLDDSPLWLIQLSSMELKRCAHAGGLPQWLSGKDSDYQCRSHSRSYFDPWVGRIPWRRAWPPTPLFLPVKSRGQRSLVGYNPWGCKEWDTTEHACTSMQGADELGTVWACVSVRPVAVLSFSPAAGQAACRPLGQERSLGRRELQLSFVQEPCPHTLFCVLLASAEPGLLGVVDKEKEMNNLYFTFSQRLPTGLLSRKNIPGYSLSLRACARSNPLSPLHTGI